MPRITRVREAGDAQPCRVEFHVYEVPEEGRLCGYTMVAGKDEHGNLEFSKTPYGVPVEPAWMDARYLAERCEDRCWPDEIELVVVDPDDLFPAAR
jgi:hypothetical protein